MKYRVNIFTPGDTFFYLLEPGDGTFYEFTLTKMCPSAKRFFLDMETNKTISPPENIDNYHFSGWGNDTWMIVLCVGGRAKGVGFVGSYEVEHAPRYAARELGGQLNDCEHTGIVLLAALSVLTKNPADISGACQRMIQARSAYLIKV